MSNNKLEQKYSKSFFFSFLMTKNLNGSFIAGLLIFFVYIIFLLFFGKILDNKFGITVSLALVIICIILVTRNFFLSIFEFYKKDSYNSFLISNFVYKTKLIRVFYIDKVLSMEAKLNFIRSKKPEIDVDEEIDFLSIKSDLNDLKMEAGYMYTEDFFIKHEKYELLFPSFKKLFNSDYVYMSLYENYFWNTKETFNSKALEKECNLTAFNQLTKNLLSDTFRQQKILLKLLKQRKILPSDFIMPQ